MGCTISSPKTKAKSRSGCDQAVTPDGNVLAVAGLERCSRPGLRSDNLAAAKAYLRCCPVIEVERREFASIEFPHTPGQGSYAAGRSARQRSTSDFRHLCLPTARSGKFP